MTMWDYEKEHEENAEWLRKLTVEKYNMKQNDINITGMIQEQVKEIPNQKIAEPSGVQGYWLKKLRTLQEHMAKQMDNIISHKEGIPKWMNE